MIYRANDKYRSSLRSSWISAPADTTLQVTSLPDNVPTIVTVGWGASYETIFSVSGKSGDTPSNYALTGVTRLRGADENIPTDADVNCLNHEEFFNQYTTYMGFEIQGEYDAGTEYSVGDFVTYNGSSYVAEETTTGNLPTDTDYWTLVAEKGEQGIQGEQGPQGEPGVNADVLKAITIENPTSSEDISMFFTPDAVTISEMRAVLRGSDTPSVTWTVRHHATDRSNAGNEVVTGGTVTTSTTSGSDVTSFDDATIPADSFVWFETTAQSGTVSELHLTIKYILD